MITLTILTRQDTRRILIPEGDGKTGESLKNKKKLEKILLNFQDKIIIKDLPKFRNTIIEYISLNKNNFNFLERHKPIYKSNNDSLSIDSFRKNGAPYSLLYDMYKENYFFDSIKIRKLREIPENEELGVSDNTLIAYNLFINFSEIHRNFNYRAWTKDFFMGLKKGYIVKSEFFLKSFIRSKKRILSMDVPPNVENIVFQYLVSELLPEDVSMNIYRLIKKKRLSISVYKDIFFKFELDKNEVISRDDIKLISETESELILEFNGILFSTHLL